MKAFALIFTAVSAIVILGSAQSATASIPAPGSFVAAQCGGQDVIHEGFSFSIRQVCIGQIAGAESEVDYPAVSFRFGDGTDKVFRVTNSSNLLIAMASGNVRALLYLEAADGQRSTMKVLSSKDGKIMSVAGNLLSSEGEMGYFVSRFEPVFVIMGF